MKKWNELRDRIPIERRRVTDEWVKVVRKELSIPGLRDDGQVAGCSTVAMEGFFPTSAADAERRAALAELVAYDQELGL